MQLLRLSRSLAPRDLKRTRSRMMMVCPISSAVGPCSLAGKSVASTSQGIGIRPAT